MSSYVDSLRTIYGDRLLLMDAGDVLQGQPVVTYYNYEKTDTENIAASVSNFMRYDVQTMGNHDVETGHDVYDKWVKELKCPMLGANIVSTATGLPYMKPYTVFKRNGIKIAVIGLITPGVPSWLSEELWSGLRFEDAVSSARKWMEVVKKKERPDVIVGLFHTGINDRSLTNGSLNDATHDIARQVPGFDVIFYGHDHSTHYEEVKSADGSVTVIVNPANNAMYVADAELEVSKKGRNKKLKVNIVDMGKRPVNQKYMDAFESQIDEVKKYVGTEVGSFTTSMTSRDKFFGLKKPFYNLDTAAGIIYDVDVTKPNGERIVIKSMADGTPFDETRTYRVAVNSYRAAGGGGLLTKGAGIDKAQLESRITWRGDYTLRDYIIKYVRKHSPITPKTHNNWQFVPTEWTAPAAKRDYQTLWGERAK